MIGRICKSPSVIVILCSWLSVTCAAAGGIDSDVRGSCGHGRSELSPGEAKLLSANQPVTEVIIGNLSGDLVPSDCSARELARHATGDEPSQSLAAAGRLRARSIPGPPRTASQRRRRQTPECASASSLCIMTRDNRSGKRSASPHRDADESSPMKLDQAVRAARFLLASFLIQ
jgi:hypothetical protein